MSAHGSKSGATQWRLDCLCAPAVAEQRHTQPWERMHSEVSYNNRRFFIDERRVPVSVSKSDLKDLLDQHETVVVCNVCGSVKAINNDQITEVIEGNVNYVA